MKNYNFQENYDVVICGGGIAGVAAAIASAETGAKTLLIEKSVFFGGMATGGLIYVYLPICDGYGTQVSFSLAEKLLKHSIKYGPGKDIEAWKIKKDNHQPCDERYRTTFSPAAFILAIDELLEKAGVDIYLDTLITSANVEDNKINYIEVRNKAQWGKISSKVFIDATGDAEVVRECGGKFNIGSNNLCLWAVESNQEKKHYLNIADGVVGNINGIIEPLESIYGTKNKRDYFNPKGITQFILDSRKTLIKDYSNQNKNFPLLIPTMPQYRRIAKICAIKSLDDDTYNTYIEDSIGMSSDWSYPGVIQEIPYSSMLPKDLDGIIVAGRCIDATNYSWELTRSIPAVAISGEAAGVAAALSAEMGISPSSLDVGLLQNKLRERGQKLHLSDVNLLYRNDPNYIKPKLVIKEH